MVTTAEGVETQIQLEVLRTEGCPEVQGFFFSRPKSAEETIAIAHFARLSTESDSVNAIDQIFSYSCLLRLICSGDIVDIAGRRTSAKCGILRFLLVQMRSSSCRYLIPVSTNTRRDPMPDAWTIIFRETAECHMRIRAYAVATASFGGR